MDNKIFCLETEWTQSAHDLKDESQVKPLLEFLKNSQKVDYVFRQVATFCDFDYYISHLKRPSYNNYTIVYLCFHGTPGCIHFADDAIPILDLLDFAEDNEGIFDGKIVHFGSCRTLKMSEEDIKTFKRLTKASMVTGYQRSVKMTESFIFEAWLLNTLNKHPNYRAKRLLDIAKKEMEFFADSFIFMAY